MKRLLIFALGLVLYIVLLGLLLQFDPLKMLQPIPLASVTAGMLILTLFQYKKGMPWGSVLVLARWNAFFSGLLTMLLQLLSVFSAGGALNIDTLAQKLIPLIYGSILYLIIDMMRVFREKNAPPDTRPEAQPQDIFCAEAATPIFTARGFSARECHVALKLLEGMPNKQIASQLYISEATVKKHIQNMFKKCGAADRQDFAALYTQWARECGQNEDGRFAKK